MFALRPAHSPHMTKLQELQIRQSEIREKLNNLLGKDTRTEAEDTELRELTAEGQKIEPEIRAAMIAEEDAERQRREQAGETPDAEIRERIEIRSRSRLANYLSAAARGAMPSGAEAELSAACGITTGAIPFDLWEPSPEEIREREARAVTPAPATGTGVMVRPIQPYIFTPSIAGALRIDMPAAGTGAYADMRITTPPNAEPVAKGATKTASAGALSSLTTTPKRITTALELTLEDLATVGTPTFEAATKAATSMSLSNQLDEELLYGDNSGNRLNGLIAQLTRPTNPTAVATFDDFNAALVDRVDGVWASGLDRLRMLLAPEAWRLAAKAFRDGTDDRGAVSAASYLAAMSAGFGAASRLKTPSSGANENISDCIAVRMGFPALRVACAPTWGSVSIDDIYSTSGAGTRVYTMHVLVGDVIVNFSDAYALVPLKVA